MPDFRLIFDEVRDEVLGSHRPPVGPDLMQTRWERDRTTIVIAFASRSDRVRIAFGMEGA